MADVILVDRLSKRFDVPVKQGPASLWGRFTWFIRNPTEELNAVSEISFTVAEGEVVALLGANGSGKSTTVKMLTGILTPTSGCARVLGFSPHEERRAYTQHIGVVFGQKSLLWWNIPVIESFKLYRDMYGVDRATFEARLRHFADILDLHAFLHIPVRKLSLGMRMRAEVAAALMHRPRVIFLDEPTIGLDVIGRRSLKAFLKRVNEEEGVTIVLTTHNMLDVEELCRRCIILRRGRKIYDGNVSALKAAEQHKVLEFTLSEVRDAAAFHRVLLDRHVLEQNGATYRLRVPDETVAADVQRLLASARLEGLNILPPTLEAVIERILAPRPMAEPTDSSCERPEALCGVKR